MTYFRCKNSDLPIPPREAYVSWAFILSVFITIEAFTPLPNAKNSINFQYSTLSYLFWFCNHSFWDLKNLNFFMRGLKRFGNIEFDGVPFHLRPRSVGNDQSSTNSWQLHILSDLSSSVLRTENAILVIDTKYYMQFLNVHKINHHQELTTKTVRW